MTSLLRIAPFHFLEETIAEKDNCIVPQNMWSRWVNGQTQEQEVLLVEVIQGDITHILCVEGPHAQNTNTIYIPLRCMQDFDEDEYVRVRVMKDMPPNATKIILQPFDSELLNCGIDIAAEVGAMLSHWQVLTKNTMLSVPCEQLGGIVVELFVKEIEPADTVLLRGEVPLELDEPLIKPLHQPVERPSTPIPSEPEVLYPMDEFTPMIPVGLSPQPQQIQPKKFLPFGGEGRRLGS